MYKVPHIVLLLGLLGANTICTHGRPLQLDCSLAGSNDAACVDQQDSSGSQTNSVQAITVRDLDTAESRRSFVSGSAGNDGSDQSSAFPSAEADRVCGGSALADLQTMSNQQTIAETQARRSVTINQGQETRERNIRVSDPQGSTSAPEAIYFDSDAVASEEEFERVLENLRRLAEGTAIQVSPPTTVSPTITGQRSRQSHSQHERDGRQFNPQARRTGRLEAHRRGWLDDAVANDSDLDAICQQLRVQHESEEEMRREKLRADPENIRQVEEFLRSKMGRVAPASNVKARGLDEEAENLNDKFRPHLPRDDDDCLICMEANDLKESIELNCGHNFHFGCLKTWFATIVDSPVKTCPICRTPYSMSATKTN